MRRAKVYPHNCTQPIAILSSSHDTQGPVLHFTEREKMRRLD